MSVVGAVQDPRKDIVSMRDLFPTRILLRVTEPEHVALTLGQGARDRGARADLIDETTPGVAYIGQDGVGEPVRVRFTHVTDHHIAAMAQQYHPEAPGRGPQPSTGRGLMNTTWMRTASCPDRLDLPWLADAEQVSVRERLAMAAICAQCPALLACVAFVEEQDITGGFWAGRDRDPNAAIPRTAPGWVNQPLPGLGAVSGLDGLGGLGGAA